MTTLKSTAFATIGQRPTGVPFILAKGVLFQPKVNAPNVVERAIGHNLTPHSVGCGAHQRAPPIDSGAGLYELLRRIAEHIIGKQAAIDIQVA